MDFATADGDPVSETQLVRIAYGLVAETGQYPEDCRAWRNQDDKSCTIFHAHLIEAQDNLRERQQTSRQGGYGANNLVGIEEAFTNLAHTTAEDRAAVTNLTEANIHLKSQVAAQANNMTTKDAAMETMQNIIQQLQGELKTLKSNQAGQSTKNANPSSYKKGNWQRSKYCWTHGIVGYDGNACLKKSDGHKEKATPLNRMGGSTRGIPEGAWWLCTNNIDNKNESLSNNDITNVLEYLKHTNNNCNKCRGNPPKNNPTYGISDTGTTKNYIKVDTPSSNKIKTSQEPWVILTYGSIMQETHKAELNISPLLSARLKKPHLPPPSIRGTNLHRATMWRCMYSHIHFHNYEST